MAITNAQQVRQLRRKGGIMGSNAGSMLVTPTLDGSRPGYYGPDAGFGDDDYKDQAASSSIDQGQAPGGSDEDFQRARDAIESRTTGAPPKKPKAPPVKTKDRFVPPIVKAVNYVGGMIKDSRLGRYLNAKARENYLNNLKETNPELYQDTVDDLEKLGYATRDVEIYGPKGKQDGPMAPGRDIETFQDLYEDQAKSILNTVTDKDDGSPGTLYDDYLDSLKPPTGEGDGSEQQDPCKGPNPPAYCFIGAKADETMEEDPTGGMAFRFMNRGGMPMDAPTTGGIIDLETGRQMYFLGKLVKKATRAVKKIVKSPIGKAALAFGAYKLGSGFMNKEGLGGLLRGKLLGTGALYDSVGGGTAGLLKDLGLIKGGFGSFGGLTGRGTMAGIAALSLSPFLFSSEQEEEDDEQTFDRGRKLDIANIRANPYTFIPRRFAAEGGSMKEPVAKKTMPLIDMDGKEKDYRETGGFVDIGRMERADDVPARLSKNEFVFTADAVRNAGDGSVDKGAEVMYNMMKNLESGGEVSEESQGLEGARKMFQTSQRLEEVL